MTELFLPRVLVVDDEASVRDFLRMALEPVAARVEVTCDAASALEAVESGAFDIVVCDIKMPGTNGLELLKMAQQSQWDTGFILITGFPDSSDIIQALRLRAADFLLKPFDVVML